MRKKEVVLRSGDEVIRLHVGDTLRLSTGPVSVEFSDGHEATLEGVSKTYTVVEERR